MGDLQEKLMTKNQRIRLMGEWWPNACQAQGWPVNDREFRLKVFSNALEREITSANEINNTNEFDRIKAYLLAAADDLPGALETGDPSLGDARRFRNVIAKDILPCLALYENDAKAYLQTVVSDLVGWNRGDRPTRPPTLDDLSANPIPRRDPPDFKHRMGASQLEQAMMTLNARLHTKRRAAGHSLHQMKTLAGVRCSCKECSKQRALAAAHANTNPF